jgi:hypothetical protein
LRTRTLVPLPEFISAPSGRHSKAAVGSSADPDSQTTQAKKRSRKDRTFGFRSLALPDAAPLSNWPTRSLGAPSGCGPYLVWMTPCYLPWMGWLYRR